MIYYTIVPRLLGVYIPVHSEIDISPLTSALVAITATNFMLWMIIYVLYPIAGKRISNIQATLIKRSQGKDKSLVSIIIPAKNEQDVIGRTIASCINQVHRNLEVLVVCHNCSDDTVAQARSTDKRVKVFDLVTEQAGKGIALNFGVDNASGEYILVLDADGILAQDFIKNALPLFDAGYAAVQGKIMPSNREFNTITKLLSLEGDLFSVPFMAVRNFLDKRTPLGGTGVLIRKEILVKVGKFRNELIDDFELSFRLYRSKYRIAFAPLSVVFDEKPPNFGLLFNQRSRWVKGHIDLLKEVVPERTDFFGIVYWLSPIFSTCGFALIVISSTAIMTFLLFGFYPYSFSFIPITIWIAMTGITYVLQWFFIMKDLGIRKSKYILYSMLLVPFSHYWYVALIKSIRVKSWATTKTTHGFIVPEITKSEERAASA